MTDAYNFLAIDVGNTLTKLTLFDEGGIPTRRQYDSHNVDEIISIAERSAPSGVAIAAVGHVDVRLPESLRSIFSERFLMITPTMELPIGINYDNPQSLGLDRKIGAVAAATLYPEESTIVADAGTALTLDVIQAGSGFIGGNIAPGLQLRFGALHNRTARLPLVGIYGEGECLPISNFGRSTSEAIRNGVAGGLLDEIVAFTILAKKNYHARRIIITGGDGEWIAHHLQHRMSSLGVIPCGNEDFIIDYQPDLLARGLRIIYEQYEKII